MGKDATEWGVKQTYEIDSKALEELKAKPGVQVIKFEEQEQLEAAVPDMIEEWIKEMAKIGKEAEAKVYAAAVRKELGL